MIKQTPYSVDRALLDEAGEVYDTGKQTINEPTGRFFYDPWTIKPEFKNTVWAKILETLPVPVGEARVIFLESGTSYAAHADIDDRYHLNLRGEDCYLIDLENNELHLITPDGKWYDMDAGLIHTAANFGRGSRAQLVVRQLLNDAQLTNPKQVVISVGGSSEDDSRFVFDKIVSPWLNKVNKSGHMNNFKYEQQQIKFTIDSSVEEELKILIQSTDFILEVL